jgi:hypothetical protein
MLAISRSIIVGLVIWSSLEGRAEPSRPASLKWIDLESRQTLFTGDDIMRFDWDEQLFELHRDAAINLMMLPPALQREFVVLDGNDNEIFRGNIVSSLSSATYKGPTIVVDPTPGFPQPPLYSLSSGYPREQGKARLGAQFRAALNSAGVLADIDRNQLLPPIETRLIEWCAPARGLKIAATLFPETFRVGRDARLLLRIYKDPQFDLRPERLELVISLNLGAKGELITHLTDVPVANLDRQNSVFEWSGKPWLHDLSGESLEEDLTKDPAVLQIELRALNDTSPGPRIIEKWVLPPQKIRILPKEVVPK